MVAAFLSYSHADASLRDEFEIRLAMLKRQGLLSVWNDRDISVGDNLDPAIREQLDRAGLVFLLVSPEFLASDYCYGVELARAIERHNEGTARVIAIILRPCEWKSTPLAALLVAPRNGKPLTRWPDRDEAWQDVVASIRKVIEQDRSRSGPTAWSDSVATEVLQKSARPRSSNLRVRQEFSDADKNRFLKDAYKFITDFFEASLEELQRRHPTFAFDFMRVDALTFTAILFKSGKKAGECLVSLDSGRMGFGAGITFSYDTSQYSRSYNEALSVEWDDQTMFLKPMGMRAQREGKLTYEGAAELFWGMLMERVQ